GIRARRVDVGARPFRRIDVRMSRGIGRRSAERERAGPRSSSDRQDGLRLRELRELSRRCAERYDTTQNGKCGDTSCHGVQFVTARAGITISNSVVVITSPRLSKMKYQSPAGIVAAAVAELLPT